MTMPCYSESQIPFQTHESFKEIILYQKKTQNFFVAKPMFGACQSGF